MSKKLFIALILCIGVVVTAAVYESFPQTKPLVVLSTSPVDRASQNPFLPLTITFNRAPKENEVSISIVPGTKTANSINGNSIKIIPETTFLPDIQYVVSVNTSPSYSFSFTTQTDIGNSPGSHIITAEENGQYRQQNATRDAELSYIRLHVPIKGNGFTVDYSYVSDTYSVSLSAPHDNNKTAFLAWLKQNGVVDLTNLRINYIDQ